MCMCIHMYTHTHTYTVRAVNGHAIFIAPPAETKVLVAVYPC